MSEKHEEYLRINKKLDEFRDKNCGLEWVDTPTEAGWYWMKCQTSSKTAVIRLVNQFGDNFIVDGTLLDFWKDWKFCGPLIEP